MITKILIKKRGRPTSIKDPVIFSVYQGQIDEPLSETSDRVIAALKTKYKNTNFYADSSCEGYDIKIKQNLIGGEIIQITEHTLDSVRNWTTNAFSRLDEIIPKNAE